MQPIKQNEEFFTPELQEELQAAIRPADICYYKSFRGKPDPEFDARCDACNGFPYRNGCSKYTTREHIEDFYKRHSLINPNKPIKMTDAEVSRITGLDDIEQFGGAIPRTLDDIGSWRGTNTFGN